MLNGKNKNNFQDNAKVDKLNKFMGNGRLRGNNKFINGYVLIESLISIQILLVIVVFIITSSLYYQKSVADNSTRQQVMYVLQNELELYITEQTASSHQAGQLSTESKQYYKTINKQNIQIKLLWEPTDMMLVKVRGEAVWDDKNLSTDKKIIYTTNQYINVLHGWE